MLQILILSFITLTQQSAPSFNFSQFGDQNKIQQIYYLTRFLDLERKLNLTTQQAEKNANFALELWVNTENIFNQTAQQIHNHSIINIINNEQFLNIIPQDKEGLQETQKYLEQWQNQTDDNKSIILQYLVENINDMIYQDDPSKYNKTKLIQQISNQTLILQENQQNINTTDYISPLTWQHSNVTKEEMILANFYYNVKNQNLTVQEQYEKLNAQEAAVLIGAFEKFFESNINTTNTNTTINSKGEQPIEKPQILPPSEPNNDDPLYMYMVFALMFLLLIAILFLLRRYLIQQKQISFQMNEESNVQGVSA